MANGLQLLNGMAVSAAPGAYSGHQDGLVVPVIRNIERKGLAALQTELRDLID